MRSNNKIGESVDSDLFPDSTGKASRKTRSQSRVKRKIHSDSEEDTGFGITPFLSDTTTKGSTGGSSVISPLRSRGISCVNSSCGAHESLESHEIRSDSGSFIAGLTTRGADAESASSNVDTVLAEARRVDCDEDCCICMCPFNSSTDEEAAFQLRQCTGHSFHKGCIRIQLEMKGCCAVCKYPYIVTLGNMPDGTMFWEAYAGGDIPLSGFRDVGTIVIMYDLPSGVQGPQHPHPGVRFSGTSRTAYLPDNSEGREVLRLLGICFQRRLTFTVGQSLTTGQDNVVVWNTVHHKTARCGGTSSFGWPDETYFARVKDELKAKGIF